MLEIAREFDDAGCTAASNIWTVLTDGDCIGCNPQMHALSSLKVTLIKAHTEFFVASVLGLLSETAV
jgi:hypothetical protein